MLRMVFCDVDGTLLPRQTTALPPESLALLRRLTDKGVYVVIASGRPYDQLLSLFEELRHRLVFLCLDGALVMYRNCVLYKQRLMKCQAKKLFERYGGGAVYGRGAVYTVGNTPVVGKRLFSAAEIPEDYLKIELPTGTIDGLHPSFRIAYQADNTTELVAASADKGVAARVVMQKFGVTPEQAVAFGDGENDLPLLKVVGHPYRMAGALQAALPQVPEAMRVEDVLQAEFHI